MQSNVSKGEYVVKIKPIEVELYKLGEDSEYERLLFENETFKFFKNGSEYSYLQNNNGIPEFVTLQEGDYIGIDTEDHIFNFLSREEVENNLTFIEKDGDKHIFCLTNEEEFVAVFPNYAKTNKLRKETEEVRKAQNLPKDNVLVIKTWLVDLNINKFYGGELLTFSEEEFHENFEIIRKYEEQPVPNIQNTNYHNKDLEIKDCKGEYLVRKIPTVLKMFRFGEGSKMEKRLIEEGTIGKCDGDYVGTFEFITKIPIHMQKGELYFEPFRGSVFPAEEKILSYAYELVSDKSEEKSYLLIPKEDNKIVILPGGKSYLRDYLINNKVVEPEVFGDPFLLNSIIFDRVTNDIYSLIGESCPINVFWQEFEII